MYNPSRAKGTAHRVSQSGASVVRMTDMNIATAVTSTAPNALRGHVRNTNALRTGLLRHTIFSPGPSCASRSTLAVLPVATVHLLVSWGLTFYHKLATPLARFSKAYDNLAENPPPANFRQDYRVSGRLSPC